MKLVAMSKPENVSIVAKFKFLGSGNFLLSSKSGYANRLIERILISISRKNGNNTLNCFSGFPIF